MAAVLVAQIRLGDPAAKDTIATLLAKEDPFWMNGLHILQKAAKTLARLGLTEDALALADQIEQASRGDDFKLGAADSAEVYSAILEEEPTLAPRILTDRLGMRDRFRVSLALADTLTRKGQPDAARSLLQGLADTAGTLRPDDQHVCDLRTVAAMQATLGFAEDAARTRQRGFALASAAKDPEVKSFQLIVLAASFPDNDAGSLRFALGCLDLPE
jgi:hypothetical protein